MVKLKINKTSIKEKIIKKTSIQTQRSEFEIMRTIVYLCG
jgi:hypothetical protein